MSDFFDNIKSVLRSTPPRWIELTRQIPEELLRRQPVLGEWSALECLQHLVELDRAIFPLRVRALLAGEDFPAYTPDESVRVAARGADPAALAAEFAALRRENLVLVDQISEQYLACTAVHAELGPVTLGQLLNEWAAHDLMHTVQAEQALMQTFIQGSGPWLVYFTKHTAAVRE